jgi:hypothetical protein
MKVLTVAGEELVGVTLKDNKNGSLTSKVDAPVLGVSVTNDLELRMERNGRNLLAHVRVPGMVKLDLMVEPSDISAFRGALNKDVISFLLGSIFRRH